MRDPTTQQLTSFISAARLIGCETRRSDWKDRLDILRR